MSKRQKSASTADPTTAMLMNPYYAITLDPGLFGEHPPLVSEDQWGCRQHPLDQRTGYRGVPAAAARRT